MVVRSKWVDRRVSRLIAWALNRWTTLEARDYSGLLHLAKGYAVAKLHVQPDDWLADRELRQIKLADEGVLVLGIARPDGTYFGAPRGQTNIQPGDTLIVYAHGRNLTTSTSGALVAMVTGTTTKLSRSNIKWR